MGKRSDVEALTVTTGRTESAAQGSIHGRRGDAEVGILNCAKKAADGIF